MTTLEELHGNLIRALDPTFSAKLSLYRQLDKVPVYIAEISLSEEESLHSRDAIINGFQTDGKSHIDYSDALRDAILRLKARVEQAKNITDSKQEDRKYTQIIDMLSTIKLSSYETNYIILLLPAEKS